MAMWYQSEINRLQRNYEEWCQACANFLTQLKNPAVVDREIMHIVQAHPDWRKWSEARPPDLHNITVQLLNAASGSVKRDPFLARQQFERNLVPRPKESVEDLLVRIDRELSSLFLTLQIKIPDDELISRVMYNALSLYPHLTDFLIPFKTGEKTKPSRYSEFKAMVTSYDTAKDPTGRQVSDAIISVCVIHGSGTHQFMCCSATHATSVENTSRIWPQF